MSKLIERNYSLAKKLVEAVSEWKQYLSIFLSRNTNESFFICLVTQKRTKNFPNISLCWLLFLITVTMQIKCFFLLSLRHTPKFDVGILGKYFITRVLVFVLPPLFELIILKMFFFVFLYLVRFCLNVLNLFPLESNVLQFENENRTLFYFLIVSY